MMDGNRRPKGGAWKETQGFYSGGVVIIGPQGKRKPIKDPGNGKGPGFPIVRENLERGERLPPVEVTAGLLRNVKVSVYLTEGWFSWIRNDSERRQRNY